MSNTEGNVIDKDDIFDEEFFLGNPTVDAEKEICLGEAHDEPDSKPAELDVQTESTESTNYSPNITSCDSPSIPALIGSPSIYPRDYLDLVERIQEQYKKLPAVDYDAVYDEVEKLAVRSSPTPTLQTLNDELQRIQGMKDRLVEIYVNVLKCYNTKKRCTDILQDSWGKYSDEKNAEKRKGDAVMCVNMFILDTIKIETLMKYCLEIMKNLDSIQDTTSRRVTIMQSILKIDFYARSALPDQDFKYGTNTKPNRDDSVEDSSFDYIDDGKLTNSPRLANNQDLTASEHSF